MGRILNAVRRTIQCEGIKGFPGLARRAKYRLFNYRQETSREQEEKRRYQLLSAQMTPDANERTRQHAAVFQHRLSILIPTWNTEPVFLQSLADSLMNQTCDQWEACLYDGCSTRKETRALLQQLSKRDARFRIELGSENLRISGNTNRAAKLATGDWIALCDHDDLLTPDAVYHILTAAEAGADFVYSDEDRCSEDDHELFLPHLKPDFSPDALRSGNYICHLMAMEKSLFDRVGGLRSDFDGSQDHDLALRATEQAHHIVHIPRVLYHWRVVGSSFSHQSAMRCYDAAVHAVAEQIDRQHMNASVHMDALQPHMVYAVPPDTKASLIISVSASRLTPWLRRLLGRTSWPVHEIILVTRQPAPVSVRDVSLLTVPTLSDAVERSTGTHLVFLAQGMLPLSKNWLRELLSLAAQPDVAMAGANILDRRWRYLHAGYAVDVPGGAVSYLSGQSKWGACYQNLNRKLREVSGVSSAACAIAREKYRQLGGFGDYESDLRGAVLGVHAMQAGYRNLLTPYADMYYREKTPCLTGPAPAEDLRRMVQDVGEHPAEHYYSPLFEKQLGCMMVDTERKHEP